MLRIIKGLLFAGALAISAVVQAQNVSALVVAVNGDVRLDAGSRAGVEAFTRLFDGDKVRLGKEASLSLIYPRSGRQENWTGVGAIAVAASGESQIQSGKPSLEVRVLPAKLAQQIARTPSTDASGKAGMVRMRNLPGEESPAEVEKNYLSLREAAPTNDHTPEIYLLAGLRDVGAVARLSEELGRLERAYPEDRNMQKLIAIYRKTLEAR